jgi:hypothetical protein
MTSCTKQGKKPTFLQPQEHVGSMGITVYKPMAEYHFCKGLTNLPTTSRINYATTDKCIKVNNHTSDKFMEHNSTFSAVTA